MAGTVSLVQGHLSGPAQRVYELLADHPGPDATSPPMAAVLGLHEADVSAALRELNSAHLVDRWPGDRYSLAARVRQHAAQVRSQERPSVRTQQRARLVDWYAATAEAAALLVTPDAHWFSPPVTHEAVPLRLANARRARAWFDWEHPVLHYVAATALGWQWDDLVIELADAVWHLARPTYHHHDLVGVQLAGHTAAARSQPAIAPVFQARAAAGLSDLGRHDDACRAATEAAAHAHDLGDPHVLAMTLSLCGRAQLAAGRAEKAFQQLSSALRPQRGLIDDRHGHAVLHRRIGQAYLALGHHDQAILHLRESRTEMLQAGHPLGAARASTSLAGALRESGRAGRASAELQQASAFFGDTVAMRYRTQYDLENARAAYDLNDTGITRRLADTVISQLIHAGPGAASDLQTAVDLRSRL